VRLRRGCGRGHSASAGHWVAARNAHKFACLCGKATDGTSLAWRTRTKRAPGTTAKMGWFAASPPLPEQLDSSRLVPMCILAAFVSSVLLAGYLYLRRKWPKWFHAAAEKAFNEVDHNHSGTVDAQEMYTCVLWIYLTLNEYGLKVCAPDRPTVEGIMKASDVDSSGALDFEEFKRALDVLMGQTLGRAITQLLFTLLCPPISGLLIKGVLALWTITKYVLDVPADIVPEQLRERLHLREVGDLIPESVPVLLLSTLLMLSLPFGLAKVDEASKAALIGRLKED
jgi:hypothetical protein